MSDNLPISDQTPTLTRANKRGDMILLSFDGKGKIPDPKALQKEMLKRGYRTEVSQFRTDIVSGTQGNVNFRVDVMDANGSSSKRAAEALHKELTGGSGDVVNPSTFEQMGSLKDRYTAAHRVASSGEGQPMGLKYPANWEDMDNLEKDQWLKARKKKIAAKVNKEIASEKALDSKTLDDALAAADKVEATKGPLPMLDAGKIQKLKKAGRIHIGGLTKEKGAETLEANIAKVKAVAPTVDVSDEIDKAIDALRKRITRAGEGGPAVNPSEIVELKTRLEATLKSPLVQGLSEDDKIGIFNKMVGPGDGIGKGWADKLDELKAKAHETFKAAGSASHAPGTMTVEGAGPAAVTTVPSVSTPSATGKWRNQHTVSIIDRAMAEGEARQAAEDLAAGVTPTTKAGTPAEILASVKGGPANFAQSARLARTRKGVGTDVIGTDGKTYRRVTSTGKPTDWVEIDSTTKAFKVAPDVVDSRGVPSEIYDPATKKMVTRGPETGGELGRVASRNFNVPGSAKEYVGPIRDSSRLLPQSVTAVPTTAAAAAAEGGMEGASVAAKAESVAKAAGSSVFKRGIGGAVGRAGIRVLGKTGAKFASRAIPVVGEALAGMDLASMAYEGAIGVEDTRNVQRTVGALEGLDRFDRDHQMAREENLNRTLNDRDDRISGGQFAYMNRNLEVEATLNNIIDYKRNSLSTMAIRMPPSPQELAATMMQV